MDLLKDFNFVMINITRKMSVLLKNHLNYLEDNIFECFLRSIIDLFFINFIYIKKFIKKFTKKNKKKKKKEKKKKIIFLNSFLRNILFLKN